MANQLIEPTLIVIAREDKVAKAKLNAEYRATYSFCFFGSILVQSPMT
jgi:hypothetical protein